MRSAVGKATVPGDQSGPMEKLNRLVYGATMSG